MMGFFKFTFGERFEVGATIRGLGVAVVNVRKGFGSGKEMCMSVGVEHLLERIAGREFAPTPEPQPVMQLKVPDSVEREERRHHQAAISAPGAVSLATTATVHVTAQCAYPVTVVSHEHFEFASHAAAPVSAEHVDQSPASPHVD